MAKYNLRHKNIDVNNIAIFNIECVSFLNVFEYFYYVYLINYNSYLFEKKKTNYLSVHL